MPRILIAILILQLARAAEAGALDKVVSVKAREGAEFKEICAALQVPCAIEINDDLIPDSIHVGVFLVNNKSAIEVLQLALKRYPKHKFSYQKGLLRIFPKEKVAGNPLDTPLGKIEFSNQKLENLWESVARKANLSSGAELVYGSTAYQSQRKFSFKIDNASARTALNAAVTHHGRAAWITHHRTTGLGTFTYLELYDYDVPSQIINFAE
jgi:hypothetical protein